MTTDMTAISKNVSLKDLASIVCSTLDESGITAVLVGGGAVSIYSDNEYESYDLDFITTRTIDELSDALRPLGFTKDRTSRYFTHPETEIVLEFPSGVLAFGDTIASFEDTATLDCPLGTIRVITPTQAIMDRLAAFIYWNDYQSREQAILVARNNPVNWKELYDWAETERVDSTIIDKFAAKVKSSKS